MNIRKYSRTNSPGGEVNTKWENGIPLKAKFYRPSYAERVYIIIAKRRHWPMTASLTLHWLQRQ